MKKSYNVWLVPVCLLVSALVTIGCDRDETIKGGDQQALLKKQVELFRDSMTSSVRATGTNTGEEVAIKIATLMFGPSKDLLLASGATEQQIAAYKDDISLMGAAFEVYAEQTSNP